jgi:hypothetical protein
VLNGLLCIRFSRRRRLAKITKVQRERAEADKFRELATALLSIRHNDWNDWEYDWLRDEVRRRPDYIYTEKEWAVLNRLQSYARSFTQYAGYTVPELIAIAYPYRFDLDEDGQDFVEKLHAWGATSNDAKLNGLQEYAVISRASDATRSTKLPSRPDGFRKPPQKV